MKGGVSHMNKAKFLSYAEKALLIIAAALVMLAFVLSPLVDEPYGFKGLLTSSVTFSVLGAFWILLAVGLGSAAYLNPKFHKVGIWVTLVTYVTVLAISLVPMTGTNVGISCIVALIGAIVYFVCLLLNAIGCLIPKTCSPDNDPRIQAVLKWKELADQGIISKEEFEEKRCAILGIKKDKTK